MEEWHKTIANELEAKRSAWERALFLSERELQLQKERWEEIKIKSSK